jgi:hypothetical protein
MPTLNLFMRPLLEALVGSLFPDPFCVDCTVVSPDADEVDGLGISCTSESSSSSSSFESCLCN